MSFVYNHDVRGLHTRINRFIVELLKSGSSSVSQVSSFDQARLQSYLTAVKTYHAWVVGQPQLDLPETNPREYELDENPNIEVVENESVRDVIVLLELARDELVNSQSARNASGVIGFDSTRFLSVVDKAQAFLDTYIADVTPLDLPESSPMREVTGPGDTGV